MKKSNTKKAQTFWSQKREQTLMRLWDLNKGKVGACTKISKKFNSVVSPNAVYKKLGRMGIIDSPCFHNDK